MAGKRRVLGQGGRRLRLPSQEKVPIVPIKPTVPTLSGQSIRVSSPISCLSEKGELIFSNRTFRLIDP